jgi:hypothetical protein
VSAPFVGTGKDYFACVPPDQGSTFFLLNAFAHCTPQGKVCTGAESFDLKLKRPNKPLPWTFDIAKDEASLVFDPYPCTSGTVTVSADAPHWSVDITCSELSSGQVGPFNFVGTFNGES